MKAFAIVLVVLSQSACSAASKAAWGRGLQSMQQSMKANSDAYAASHPMFGGPRSAPSAPSAGPMTCSDNSSCAYGQICVSPNRLTPGHCI